VLDHGGPAALERLLDRVFGYVLESDLLVFVLTVVVRGAKERRQKGGLLIGRYRVALELPVLSPYPRRVAGVLDREIDIDDIAGAMERVGLGDAYAVAGPDKRHAQRVLALGEAIFPGFSLVLGMMRRCRAIARLQTSLGHEQIAAGIGEELNRRVATALRLVLAQEGPTQIAATRVDRDIEEIGDDLHAPALLDRLISRRCVGDVVARRRAVIALIAGHGPFRSVAGCGGGVTTVGGTLGGCRCRPFTPRSIVDLPGLPDQEQQQTERPIEK
jgi:hypothetical protein